MMGFKPTMSFRLRFCRPLPSFTRLHVLLDWSVTIRLSSRYQRDAFPIKLQSNLVPRSGIDPLPSACKTETLPLRHRGIYFVLLERLELSYLSIPLSKSGAYSFRHRSIFVHQVGFEPTTFTSKGMGF